MTFPVSSAPQGPVRGAEKQAGIGGCTWVYPIFKSPMVVSSPVGVMQLLTIYKYI